MKIFRFILFLMFFLTINLSYSQQNINICENGNTFTYFVTGLPNSTFNWTISSGAQIISNNNSSVIVIYPDSNATYTISVIEISEFDCIGEEQKIIVNVKGCFFYFIPNAFTVNSDFKNEVFNLKGYNLNVDNYSMLIYNRWGQLIYETDNIDIGWNGSFNGSLCPQGVYTYKISFEKDSKLYQEFGQVNLLR